MKRKVMRALNYKTFQTQPERDEIKEKPKNGVDIVGVIGSSPTNPTSPEAL